MTEKYITYEHGVIWEVRCPCCNVPIRKMVVAERPLATEKINNQLVTKEHLVLACLPNYREVLMAMGDGSFHVSPMCEACANDLTIEKVEQAASADPMVVGSRKPTLALRADSTIRE